MKNWLVTGGEGFIGGRIARATGATLYDLKSAKDILDTQELLQACGDVDGIFHCAAKISVPESFREPEEYHLHNVQGTASVTRAAKARNAKVVFSSSAAVYGESDTPVRETDALHPMSPYAQNKKDGEALLKESGIPYAVLRYFNVYGPGQSAAYAGVITMFIHSALRNEDLVIYGDGTQVRDFVYVDDVVAANIRAMESEGISGETFNIGSGTMTSIGQLAEEIIRLTGSGSRITYKSAREGDIVYSQADVSMATNILNWKASVSLTEGLERTIESYRDV
ncbi:MAG: NAD-dependent epimerase/dehydratase family protein [Patescibacteria group bacterium]